MMLDLVEPKETKFQARMFQFDSTFSELFGAVAFPSAGASPCCAAIKSLSYTTMIYISIGNYIYIQSINPVSFIISFQSRHLPLYLMTPPFQQDNLKCIQSVNTSIYNILFQGCPLWGLNKTKLSNPQLSLGSLHTLLVLLDGPSMAPF